MRGRSSCTFPFEVAQSRWPSSEKAAEQRLSVYESDLSPAPFPLASRQLAVECRKLWVERWREAAGDGLQRKG